MGLRPGFSLLPSFLGVPKRLCLRCLCLRRLCPNRKRSLISSARRSYVPATTPTRRVWWSICPIPPATVTLWTLTVLLSPHLPVTSYYASAGIPAPACGFYPRCMHQKDSLLRRPCHIDARSNQCEKTMLPYCTRVLPFWRSPQSAVKSFVCCGGSPGS